MKTKEILNEISDLPVEMGAQLAEEILETLNPVTPDIQQEWVEEVHRRMKSVKEGKSNMIPGEQVFKEADKITDR